MKRAAILLLALSCNAKAMDAELMVDIIECESSGRHDVVGDDGSSIGIAQYKKATFELFKRKAGMPHLKWKNPIHQMRLMIWMVDNGYIKHWSALKSACYKKLQKERLGKKRGHQ
jgi:hypothetical protein